VTRGRLPATVVDGLRRTFGARLEQDVTLAGHTTARIGGPAEFLLVARSADELAQTAASLWGLDAPFRILGGGSNVLVSDEGVSGVVVLNEARDVRFRQVGDRPAIWAESGASLGLIARRAAERGWSGLEWAATVPGTVGGAVVGNAGAHGSDMAASLAMAGILQRDRQVETWTVDRLEYAYRESWLKRHPGQAVVLSATFGFEPGQPEAVKARMAEFAAQRGRTQPPGASMGSMFKNPPGDFAGRLIEAAGLKGMRSGMAEISNQHANFFVNLGSASAGDVWGLIQTAQSRVKEAFGIVLELEIELLGDWNPKRMAVKDVGGGVR
jgi:UDP-N-acetylmuramate dehydrogenase